MRKWKIAIIGSGYMAHEHAKAFASLPNVAIAGVCGRSRERAEAFADAYGGMPVFESVAALHEGTGADAVIVAVNELSVHAVCMAVFAYPWLCFLEKPVGIDLAQAEAITAAARNMEALAYVALNRRSYASTRHALQELSNHNGARLISVLDQQDMESARQGGQPEEVVRNYMYANSIHLIDYLNLFGRGEIVTVQPTYNWDSTNPGYVIATVQYSSGDVGVYQAVWNGPGPWSVTVTNPQVRLEMRPLERLAIQRRGERRQSDMPENVKDIEFKPGLRQQAEQIIEVLEQRPTHLATLGEATRSKKLCARIYGLINK